MKKEEERLTREEIEEYELDEWLDLGVRLKIAEAILSDLLLDISKSLGDDEIESTTLANAYIHLDRATDMLFELCANSYHPILRDMIWRIFYGGFSFNQEEYARKFIRKFIKDYKNN